MKQKLGLACALIHTPQVLFLDEPTNGVDPVSRRDFWRILYQLLRERVTIFVSTAYLDEAERCNRVGLMHQGRLLACGTPDEVKRPDAGRRSWRSAAPAPREAVRCYAPRGVGSVGLFGDRVHVVVAERGRGPRRRWKPPCSAAGSRATRCRGDRAVAGGRVHLGAAEDDA